MMPPGVASPNEVRRVIDVTQQRAAGRGRGSRFGIHPHAAHAREVDDEPVVDTAQATAVVAPAADGDVQPLRRART